MRKTIILLLTIFLGFIGIAYYYTNSVEICRYQIQNSSLGEVLGGIKMAFISDLHIKDIGVREKKVLEILKEEKPDLILLGGDYIQFKNTYEPVMYFLQHLKSTHGVYAVMGNTEYSNENGSCVLCHSEKSPKLNENPRPVFLRNSSTTLTIDGKTLDIAGVDDPVNKKSDLNAMLKRNNAKNPINPINPIILLSHSPEVFKEATQMGIDFILCGHNHGGQIFLTKYLRKILHLDPALDFLEGFYQEGKTLMYVSRGVGTSFLPFRLGVKPEITFFTFSDGPNPSKSSFMITNSPSKTIFTGLSISGFLDLFNLSWLFSSLTPFNAINAKNASRPSPHNVLFDFESDAELERLNWECHKWFERSPEHVTSGNYSLKASLPAGQYPGINFQQFDSNWSKSKNLKMEVFNPSKEKITFHIRIDDKKSGWEYSDRFDRNFELKHGLNYIAIPSESLKTNTNPRPLDLKNIKRFMVFIPNNQMKRELFIDNIRLE